MSKKRTHFHGSDLEKIEKIYGIKKEKIVSFGANVNPLGISPMLRDALSQHPECIASYPDREYLGLKSELSQYCHVNPESILPGNGSTELISLFIKALQPEKALILGPSYSEYEHELQGVSSDYEYFPLKEQTNFYLEDTAELFARLESSLAQKQNSLFILCNPNNPTSSAIPIDLLTKIVEFCKMNAITVMVDETYVEFSRFPEQITALPLTDRFDNLIVLRGISKFFAAPGLRLGYAVTSNSLLRNQFLALQYPWSINSFAALYAGAMFRDQLYIIRTRNLISSERERVVNQLLEIPGLKIYPPAANFVLVRITNSDYNAASLFDAAITEGLMIRDCSDFTFLGPDYFRFCFMLPKDNDRLLDVIRKAFYEK